MAEELSKGNRRDPGWKYNYLKDPNDPTKVTCNFCGKTTTGGINRAKQHLIGNFRNASKCTKCPPEVREELKTYMEEKKIRKEVYTKEFCEFDEINYQDDDGGADEVQEIMPKKRGGGIFPSGSSKKSKGKGPMDVFMQKQGTLRQTNIRDSCDKEARALAIQKIARFFYDAAIPFNVANLKSFKEAVETVGRYDPNLKPPSYHELRVPLLRKEVELTNEMLNQHREEWKKLLFLLSFLPDCYSEAKLCKLLFSCVFCAIFLPELGIPWHTALFNWDKELYAQEIPNEEGSQEKNSLKDEMGSILLCFTACNSPRIVSCKVCVCASFKF